MVKLVWELLKKQSVAMVSHLVVGSRLNSKYRLRLLAMLSVVFGAFSFAIVAITWSKGTGTPEPFVLVASGWFKALGPSTETLVALQLVTFFLLVLLLLQEQH